MRVLAPLLLPLLLAAPLAAAQGPVFTPAWSGAVPSEVDPHAPALSSDVVIATSSDGTMQAFTLRDGGQEIWRRQLPTTRLSPPLPNGNLFLVGGEDGIVRLISLHTGEDGWFNFTTGAPVVQNMSQTRDMYVVVNEHGKVSGHAKGDGRILWQKEVGKGAHGLRMREADGTFVILTPQDVILYELTRRDQQERRTLPDIICVVETPNDEVYALRAKGVHRLRASDYVDSWVVGVPAADCGAIDQDHLYVPTRNGTIASLARHYPQVKWETPVLGAMPHLRLSLGDWIIATTNGTDGERAAVHLIDARNGTVAASHPLEGTIASAPRQSTWDVKTSGGWSADSNDYVREDWVIVRTDTHMQALRLVLPDRDAGKPVMEPFRGDPEERPATPPSPIEEDKVGAPSVLLLLAALGAVAAIARRR